MEIRGVTGSVTDGILTPEQQQELDARQALVCHNVQKYWDEHGDALPYPLVAMPTGFGKGRVVHRVLQHIKKSFENSQTLLVVGTKNVLLNQSQNVLASLVQDETEETSWSIMPNPRGNVVLTTLQGLGAHLKKSKVTIKFALGVIDEAHNIGTKRRLEMLKRLKPKRVVGLTATAHRSSGEFRSPEQYGFTVVDSMTLPECINKRWLSPLVGISIDSGVILPADVRQGAELNLKKLYKALRNNPELFTNIAADIAKRFLPTGMKTVIVVNRVDAEACVIAEELIRRGFKVGLAVNQTAARKLHSQFVTLDAIERYKLPNDHPNAIQVLISPQVIGEGFDAPATECVVWAAPTLSALRYTQVIGRGSRRCWGKKYCLIVDYVYLIEKYGYSYNFAQFFRKEEMQELDGGLMYVGPEDVGQTIDVPSKFTSGGKIVSVVDLQKQLCPFSGDWLPILSLTMQVGKSKTWVERCLAEKFSDQGELRLNNHTGRKTLHYPPSVLEELRSIATELKPAGNWLSIYGCSSLVPEKSHKWVAARLRDHFSELGELRIDNRGNKAVHYPPSVVQKLKDMAKATQPADDWLTLYNLAEDVKRTVNWVEPRLEENFPNVGQIRLDRAGSPRMHFPPTVLPKLRELSGNLLSAGEWLSLNEVTSQLGKSTLWVRNRLKEHFPNLGEMRRSRGRNKATCIHYPPNIVEKLRKYI